MHTYVTGDTIKQLREQNHLTQSQLADKIQVSNKTISKWENGKGLPDISLLDSLAKALNVSLIELMSGDLITNKNKSNNMKRTVWYVCPVCGNVIHAMGDAVISCCGLSLMKLEEEDADSSQEHEIMVERIDDEYVVSLVHPMRKDHYISFIAYRTDKGIQMEKMYSESEALCRFKMAGRGKIFAYCNHHGLFVKKI